MQSPQNSPPNLRVSKDAKRCVNCKNFIFAAGRAWKGDGHCTLYRDSPVREDFVCDVHEKIDD